MILQGKSPKEDDDGVGSPPKKKRGRPPSVRKSTTPSVINFNVGDNVLHIIKDDDDDPIIYYPSVVVGVYHTLGSSPMYDIRYRFKEDGDDGDGDLTIKTKIPEEDLTKVVDLR